ncbi:GFA family protein [Psychromarinibacter sp. C21-152]|uniref:GFA family protein n=1 Tax=Psychromarinibacter sediminicola TaxID=3033385 RepID=A0AAE3NWN0_9RHOB|nr:GFA family protein [Psychromarinibacter sediminicola]MDF0603636.1 GFA family protein [Psychromarinibacter sediminicola]
MLDGQGRCLCGQVRYKFDPEAVLWQGHCHCESCRRACSAPFTTFFGVRASAWRWFGKAPSVYRSSPGVERFFCGRCGSQMAYRSDRAPGEIHGYAASLDRPELATPERHEFAAEMLPWVHLADDLPRE